MREPLKKYKGSLILSSLLILLPIPISFLCWDFLWLSPLWILATHWFCLLFAFRDPGNRQQHPKALGMVIWLCPLLSLFSGTVVGLVREDTAAGVSVFMSLLFWFFGLLFVLLGNYFPKLRHNRTMGIKTRWNLENEENWNATHRFGGKVWVICGFLCMACGLFPDRPAASVLFVVLILAVALVPFVYSYLYYKRQRTNGQAAPLKFQWKLAVPLTLFTLVFVGYVLFSGSMEMVYGDTSFTVDASGWGDLTVEYAKIQDIQYYDQDPSDQVSGMRTNGFGNLRMGMGRFRNELYGDYTRYTFVRCDACVVLAVDGETIVLNGPDPEATQEIYQELLRRTSRQ